MNVKMNGRDAVTTDSVVKCIHKTMPTVTSWSWTAMIHVNAGNFITMSQECRLFNLL